MGQHKGSGVMCTRAPTPFPFSRLLLAVRKKVEACTSTQRSGVDCGYEHCSSRCRRHNMSHGIVARQPLPGMKGPTDRQVSGSQRRRPVTGGPTGVQRRRPVTGGPTGVGQPTAEAGDCGRAPWHVHEVYLGLPGNNQQ